MYYSKYYEEDNKVKKLSLLLALVILGFSVCCAEADTSFPLRSGIEFGDTKEEVFTKCVHHRNCAAKPAKLSMDSAEIEQRFRVN